MSPGLRARSFAAAALSALVGAALLAAAPGGRAVAPQIVVAPTSLAFGPVTVGTLVRDTLTISNPSTTTLILGELGLDDPQFAVGGASGGVPPGTAIAAGGSLRVEVAFRPDAQGPVAATLLIPSNDPARPEVSVPITGSGAAPPVASVTPDSIGVALTIGQTATRSLQIHNGGEATLDWTLGVQPAAGLRGLGGVTVLWDRSKGQAGTVGWSQVVNDLRARGATVSEIPAGATITAAVLSGGRIFVSADPALDVVTTWSPAERTALSNWVQGGGAMLLIGDNGTTVAKFNSLLTALGAGMRMSATGGTQQVVVSGTRIATHPTTVGVDRIWIGVGVRTLSPVNAPAVTIVRDGADLPVVAMQSLGVGRLAVFCDELFDDVTIQDAAAVSAKNFLFAQNTFDYLGGDLWVRPAATSGSVPAASFESVGLTVDPGQLRGGEYDLDLRVASNDPVNPVVLVPIHLALTGFPEIAVSPATLSFSAVPQDEPSMLPLIVRNSGTEPLTVTDVTSSSTRFVALPTSFTLAPAAAETLDVTFTPDSVGVFGGTLTVLSNAATSPSRDVPADGNGVVNCALPCVPPALRPADVQASNGYSFWLDVSLSGSPAPISSFGFELTFDPHQLAFQDSVRAEGLSAGFVVLAQTNEPGRLTCGGFGTTPIPAGSSGTLLRLHFLTQCDTCTAGVSSELRIDEAIEDLVGVHPCCGTFTFAECPSGDGDVNRDLVLTATDALCALKIFLNGQSPPAACDVEGECEASAADANCDDTVTPGDALAIYERVLCVAEPTPLPCLALAEPDPCGAARLPAPGPLAWGAPRAAGDGEWEIPLLARGEVPRAFGLELEAPGAQWRGAQGDAAAGWSAFDGAVGADGVLRVGGFRDGAAAVAGEIGRLRLHATTGAVRVLRAIDSAFEGPGEIAFGAPPVIAGLEVLGGHPARGGFTLLASVASPGTTRLDVVDVSGRLVCTLARELSPGLHRVEWDGRDASGRPVSSGIYFARLGGPDGTHVRKLVRIR